MTKINFPKAGALLLLTALLSGPALAQLDLADNLGRPQHQDWQERGPGPEAVDYSGLPLNQGEPARGP